MSAGDRPLTERVWYAGPEPMMVPATLADFECSHGLIGGCVTCDTPAAGATAATALPHAGAA